MLNDDSFWLGCLEAYNKQMSAYNTTTRGPGQLASSSVMFTNHPHSPHNNSCNSPSPYLKPKQTHEISSSDQTNYPQRAMLSQSLIYSPRYEPATKPTGLGKLDSMARHITTTQTEDFPSQKHNSADKAPFSRTAFPTKDYNPYASHIMTSKPNSNYFFTQEEKRGSLEPYEPEVRKRRQSVDLETMARRRDPQSDRFKFMQRTPPFQPLPSNSNQLQQKNDCESTMSGSGPEMLKLKNFDFLKKRKEVKQEKQQVVSSGTQSVKTFFPLKKSQLVWPLSISPIEQKMQRTFQFPTQPASASRAESRTTQHPLTPNAHNGNAHSAIEFKKKKHFEAPPTPPSQKPSRFNPKVTSNQCTTPEKEQVPFYKSKSSRPVRDVSIDDFQLVNKLGKGAFGEVFVAQEKTLGLICVIKKMSKKRIREAKVEQHIIRQIKLQTYLNHSHLTSLYGFFHDEDYLYLIMELLPDGSLQQVKKKKKLPEKEAVDIVKQVAVGLKYMHQEYVIHRDLKPQNLFLNEGYVKIGDFGCSIYHNQVGLRNTIVGCLEYSSPEQLSKEGYTDKIDSWSVGIMTYELMFGKSPFESDIKKMFMSNGQCKTELSEVIFPSAPVVSDEAKQFILNLLDRQPNRRMDMDEILHHPFLKQ